MLFNSLSFAVFLPFVWLSWLVGGPRWRKFVLLVGSYLFYAGGAPRFLPLLWLSTAVDYLVGLGLDRSRGAGVRRALLGVSLLVNLGVLIVYTRRIHHQRTRRLSGGATRCLVVAPGLRRQRPT